MNTQSTPGRTGRRSRWRGAALLALTLVAALMSLPALTGAAQAVPAPIPAQVVAGVYHSLVLEPDGTVRATGRNSDGQLGTGDTTERAVLTPMTGLPPGVRATAVAAGLLHSVVLGSDGIVYATGENSHGELGLGDTSAGHDTLTAMDMSPLPSGVTVTAVAAGSRNTLVLGSNGVVYGAGQNQYGVLGVGDNGQRTSLTAMDMSVLPAGVTAVKIALGTDPSSSVIHSLVLGSDDVVYAAGYNGTGAFGNDSVVGSPTLRPMTSLPAGVTPVEIAAGTHTSLVLGSDGVAYATGENSDGRLGVGDGVDHDAVAPMALPSGVDAVAIAAGPRHSLVTGSDGVVYASGVNDNGQLATGGTTNTDTPVAMTGLPAGVSASTLSAGYFHSLMLGSDGIAYAAGGNAGQTGRGPGEFNSYELVPMLDQPLMPLGAVAVTGTPAFGGTLVADPGPWNIEPDAFDYQWLRDGTAISGATGPTYSPALSDIAQPISVAVTGHRTDFLDRTAVSDEVAVTKGTLVGTAAPVVTGQAVFGGTLTAAPGSWGWTPGAVGYQWERDGSPIAGATGTTYAPVADDVGHQVRVTVTAQREGFVDGVASSAAKTIAPAVLTNTTLPAVSGKATFRKTLTATPGAWSHAPESVSYQWLRNGVPIANATGSRYKLKRVDIGRRVAVRVSANAVGYATAFATSAKTKKVAKAKRLRFTAAHRPKLKGARAVGHKLRVTGVSKKKFAPRAKKLRYQWFRNGHRIKHASKRGYALTKRDRGKKIKVRIVARKPGHKVGKVTTKAIRVRR